MRNVYSKMFGCVAMATRSLSARLLVLTTVFVMLAEVMIFVPSVAFFRVNYLEKMADSAHLAMLALVAAPDNMVSEELREQLLGHVQARAMALRGEGGRSLMLTEDMPPKVDAAFDLREKGALLLIRDAFGTLFGERARVIRVKAARLPGDRAEIEVIFDEAPLKAAMLQYSWNILRLSVVISLITAGLVYLSLQWLMVRPMRRLSESMTSFRLAPEDASGGIAPSERTDEIGVAERELKEMQTRLRAALRQKTRLAALGTAVTRVNHDLRNILATAQIVSDRLAMVEDEEVQKVVPRLIASLDRAIDLCTSTLKYGRADEPEPVRDVFALFPLVEEVAFATGLAGGEGANWRNQIPADLAVNADRDQIFRVLLNLLRNAAQAVGEGGEVRVLAARLEDRVMIDVADTGPGLPESARAHLFEPFTGSARAGGTGLGLAISRDLLRAHGGDLTLVRSDAGGTLFRIDLPDPAAA